MLLASSLDREGILTELRHTDLSLYALVIALSVVTLVLWAVGLYGLLATFGDTPDLRPYTAIYLAGTFVRRILPWGATLGNSLIAYLVSRDSCVEVERCLAATALWEFLNIVVSLVVASIGLFALVSVEGNSGFMSRGTNSIAAVVTLIAIVTVIAARREEWVVGGVLRMTDMAYSLIERVSSERVESTSRIAVRGVVRGRAEQFFVTLRVLAANRIIVGATVLTIAGAWAAQVTALRVSLLALGISIPSAVTLVTVPVAGIAGLVPLPGGLGSVDIALAGLLVVATGLSVETAAAAVLLFRVATYWLHLVLGGIGALWAGPAQLLK